MKVCAICGRACGEAQQRPLEFLKEQFLALKEPESNYAHEECIFSERKKLRADEGMNI